jgi:hypothetical protein
MNDGGGAAGVRDEVRHCLDDGPEEKRSDSVKAARGIGTAASRRPQPRRAAAASARPRTSADVYVIDHENPWAPLVASRPPWLERGSAVLARVGQELDESSVGGMRLARSAEFFEFLIDDVSGLTERWIAFLRARR